MTSRRSHYYKARRDAWIKANGPCQHCGSSERLEVDHIERESKTHHRIWSWSLARREVELAKCQVLCHICHKMKTAAENGVTFLTPTQIDEMSHLVMTEGYGRDRIAKLFGLSEGRAKYMVSKIKRKAAPVACCPNCGYQLK